MGDVGLEAVTLGVLAWGNSECVGENDVDRYTGCGEGVSRGEEEVVVWKLECPALPC